MTKFYIPALAFTAIALSACHHFKHTTLEERFTNTQEAVTVLSQRYQQLKSQETALGDVDCPAMVKQDKNAEKLIDRIVAATVHKNDGQSVMHQPNTSEIHMAQADLDTLSNSIEQCRLAKKSAMKQQKEKDPS